MKRNITGPHRCALCKQNDETIDHLFIACPFATKVWELILHGLNSETPANLTVDELFRTWKDRYPTSINNNTLWVKVWITFPKYVCWKLWLARNEQIFNNASWNPTTVAAKAKGLLLETLSNQQLKDESTLLPAERKWLGTYVYRNRNQSAVRPQQNPEWRLRGKDEEFQSWWRKQGITTIFFDGASKGNPGTAGAGGLILSQDGSSKETYSWGLGQRTNNQAEILSLIKSCQIAKERGIREIQAFEDSEILIKKYIWKASSTMLS